ncbi:MAG TPA: hypothetical protein VHU81_20305 [Thermoanaerobaculia bacterium]|nr:hypothetical protein [Thermoanaerobaculia bacterium]
MIVIHGIYNWRPRQVAFRNDFCRTCAGPRLAVQLRTFDVLHLYWIPLIPLGFWKRWHCALCGRDPHSATRTRRGFKVAGAIVLGLMAFALWALPVEPPDEAWIWGMRIGLSLAALAATIASLKHTPEPQLQEALDRVRPFEGWICPLCGGELSNIPGWHCPACGVEHKPLGRESRSGM